MRLTESADTTSFAVQRPQGNAAADALVAALRRNDRGGFWRARAVAPREQPPTSDGFAWPVGVALVGAALMRRLAGRTPAREELYASARS